MQTHKKLKARILSLALSAAMVTTMMPMNVFAAEGGTAPDTSSVGTIQSFEKLEDRFIPSVGDNAPDHVYRLSVALNTPLEDLNLPDELTAMVVRTVTAPAEDESVVDSGKTDEPAVDEVIPDEDKSDENVTVPGEDADIDDTVSDNQPASPSDTKEEVKEEIKDAETVVTTVKQETIPVTWQSNKEYKPDENGKFIYTAVLTKDYILADGVDLPLIYVMVGRQARAASDAITIDVNNGTTASGATLQEAITVSNVAATTVTELKITAGKVTTNDWYYLRDLTAMTTFEIDAAVTTVANIPNVSFSYFPKSIVTVTVPQAIIIGNSAFAQRTALTTANFPAATEINMSAFLGCTKLTTANFPAVTYIGSSVFYKCAALTSASFPAAENIDLYAFADCPSLAILKLGATPPTSVGENAFQNCPATRALGYVKTDGTVLTGTDLSNAQTAYKAAADGNTSDGLWYGWTIEPPTINIGTQPTSPAAMTYGSITGSLTVAGTASNNTVSYQWYKNTTNSATGGTAVSGAASASFTIPTTLDAGIHYYYCVLKAPGYADKASNVVTVTVNKANATGAMKTVATSISKDGKAGATVTLPTKPAGATYGTPTASGTITMTDISMSGDTLTYTAPASTAEQTGVITIPVTTATNYNDYSITVTITSVGKTPVTISGLSAATGLIYNGNAQKGYTGTISVEGNKVPVNDLLYTYTSTDSGTYNSSTAPTNAGAYKLVVTVADSNANYTGAHTDILFTIGKATVTITADNKSTYVGDAKPALTYTATGKASSDTLTIEPALEYESEPDMSKAGSVKIKAKDAVAPNTNNYESAITYVDGTLTISTKSSGGGSSSGGGGNLSNTITPPSTKPTEPVTGNSNTNATVDNKGNATVNVTDKNISDAIKAAKDAASKKGVNAGEVTVVISATSPADSNANTVTVNLPKTVQDQIISNKIGNVAIVIDKPDISIGMTLATITEMNKRANTDIQLSATRTDATKLSTEAMNAIGNRPAFDLKATYESGSKSITHFGSGTISVAIPYTLQAGEVAGGLYAVYVDGSGKVTHLTNSSYDAENKVLRFSTNHFSVYGIGYKSPVGLSDTASHWAKTDIEFVIGRGLLTGTSNTTFSPDGSITRAMFVTALGRLANVDTNSYKTGNFTDVKADAYYAPYVNWAASKGITSGTTATTFSPDNTVTRQEMAVFMSNYAKAMGYTVPETRAAVTFADNGSIGSWAAAAVKQMQMAGVLNGKNGNKFDPTGTATRAEVAAVLHRYVELVIDRTTTEGWTTNDSGSDMYYQNGKALTGSCLLGGTTYVFNNYGETTSKTNTAEATTTSALAADGKKYITYKIIKGDTLWDLAQKYGTTVDAIVALTNIANRNRIPLGTEIKIWQK